MPHTTPFYIKYYNNHNKFLFLLLRRITDFTVKFWLVKKDYRYFPLLLVLLFNLKKLQNRGPKRQAGKRR